MGLISNVVAKVATDLIEDAADNIVVTAAVGTVTAVTGAVAAGVAGVAKGVEVAGKAAVATKNAVVDAKSAVDGFIDNTKDAIDTALEATVGDKDTRHYRKELRYLSKISKNPSVIIQKVDDCGDIFRIYDPEEKLLYKVQGTLSQKEMWLSILNDDDTLVGDVYKSSVTTRAPVFHERKPVNYVVEIMGEQVAVLKTKLSKSKAKSYDIEPFGWIVQDLSQKKDFSLSNEQGVIVHGSKRKGYEVPTYILDFQQQENELAGLLLMLALISRENE